MIGSRPGRARGGCPVLLGVAHAVDHPGVGNGNAVPPRATNRAGFSPGAPPMEGPNGPRGDQWRPRKRWLLNPPLGIYINVQLLLRETS